MTEITISVEIIGLVIALILLLVTFTEKSKDRKQNILLRLMLIANCFALIFDMATWMLDGNINLVSVMTVLKVLAWSSGYLIIFYYLAYIVIHVSTNKKKNKILIGFFIIYTLLLDVLLIISVPYKLYFGYDANGFYYKSDYYFASQILGFSMYLFAILLILRYSKKLKLYGTISFISYAIVPAIGSLINIFIKEISVFYTSTV